MGEPHILNFLSRAFPGRDSWMDLALGTRLKLVDREVVGFFREYFIDYRSA